jgi:agmatine deiminase
MSRRPSDPTPPFVANHSLAPAPDSGPDVGEFAGPSTGDGRTATPAALGYRMPAEWHPHSATWLAWPTNEETWPDRLQDVRDVYVEMVRILSRRERVHLLVDDEATRETLQDELVRAGAVLERLCLEVIPTVDAWIRDYGPNFLVPRSKSGVGLAFNNWRFNAWGEKYPDLMTDDGVPRRIVERLGVPCFEPGLVLEGGSIEVNGKGLCLTTRQCLLNPNRNPRLSAPEIETALRDYLGVRRILWLEEGIAGDDTDGHIDDIARFVDESTVVCAVEEDPTDVNHLPLADGLARLKEISRTGDRFRVVPIPMPEPVLDDRGGRLPASYANFYIANGLVLVPVFGCSRDRGVLEILAPLFPGREVVGVSSADLVWGLGAIHCLTQQQPEVSGQSSAASGR